MPEAARAGRRVAAVAVFVCCLPMAAAAQQPASFTGLRINESLFVGLQALDLHSTSLGEAHGAVEANPLMRTSLGGRIALKAAGTAGVIALAEVYKRKHPRLVTWTVTALNAGYVVLVTRNYLVYRDARARAGR